MTSSPDRCTSSWWTSDSHEPSGYTAGSVQGLWLQAALAASTSTWNVVLLHHAPFSSGSHGPTLASQWPYAAWGADAVLAGHDHTYERMLQDGIPYFVNGLGGQTIYGFGTIQTGSMRRYNGDYGAMLLDADTENLTFKFITRTGLVVDSFTLGPHTPTRSDYDGDGATDPVKFVPSTGKAWLGQLQHRRCWDEARPWASDVSSYVPRSDFDGDGKADPAKFLSSGALYYIESKHGHLGRLVRGPGLQHRWPPVRTSMEMARPIPPSTFRKARSGTTSPPPRRGQGEFIGADAAPYLPASDYDGDGKTDMAKYILARRHLVSQVQHRHLGWRLHWLGWHTDSGLGL